MLTFSDISKSQHKYLSVDENYFKCWSPQMAYWLGFLAADGNIKDKANALTFVLKESDRCDNKQ